MKEGVKYYRLNWENSSTVLQFQDRQGEWDTLRDLLYQNKNVVSIERVYVLTDAQYKEYLLLKGVKGDRAGDA